jgi:hypothetical protein
MYGRNRQQHSPQRRDRHPNLEELERRNMPAPVAAGTGLLTGVLAAQLPASSAIQTPLVNVTPATAFNATRALTAPAIIGTFAPATSVPVGQFLSPIAASTSQGLPAVGVGVAAFAPFLVSTNTTPLPIGVPNPVRSGPATPATVGAQASLPGTSPYAQQDMALSGGGGQFVEFRGPPPNGGAQEESEENDEELLLDTLDVGALPAATPIQEMIRQEVTFQLTV